MRQHDDWLAQLGRHFQPFARQTPREISITAGKIDRRLNYALVVRIGDPNLEQDPQSVRQEMANSLRETASQASATIYLDGSFSKRRSHLLNFGVGVICAAGVYVVNQSLSHAVCAFLAGAGVHAIYEIASSAASVRRQTKSAGDIIRQFRPHGPRPLESELFQTDPQNSAALLYLELNEVVNS